MSNTKYVIFINWGAIKSPIVLEFTIIEDDDSNQSEDLVDMHIDNMLANFKTDLNTLRQTSSLKNTTMFIPTVPISDDDLDYPGLYVKFRGTEKTLDKVVDYFKSQELWLVKEVDGDAKDLVHDL